MTNTLHPNVGTSQLISHLLKRISDLEIIVTDIGQNTRASRKHRFLSKKQTAVYMGLSRALVVETIDPFKENRVRYFHPILHNPNTPLLRLPFASPVSNMGGFDDCGCSWVPPAGSTIIVFFEAGSRDSCFYLGTTWHRDRGVGGSEFPVAFREWQIYAGHRKGYFIGPRGDPNDESQVLPPWNTENYNSKDFDDERHFTNNTLDQMRVTFPNIYGFKTPEKHMMKMVDGNAKCNRRWKRLEIMSSCGNWMCFKDDHLHYGGQWAHPSCPPDPGAPPHINDTICTQHTGQEWPEGKNWANHPKGNLPLLTDIIGRPIEKPICMKHVEPCKEPLKQDIRILAATYSHEVTGPENVTLAASIHWPFAHSSTPGYPPYPPTKYYRTQWGANPYFKHKNECRPYKGPGTPQNNKCELNQTGIQFLSISGHTFVMDDSVEEPRGVPTWERSMEGFDYGCNNVYSGVMYMKSSTGHSFAMSDAEDCTGVRGKKNYIELKSGNGNYIRLDDETFKARTPGKQVSAEGQKCPPDYAGPHRGIVLWSTSNHKIRMIDHMNLQCGPPRTEGGIPANNATKAFIQIQSGYGLEMRFQDSNSQKITQKQWIQITHPQCAGETDHQCNSCKECICRGPHIFRMQGRPRGVDGVVYLRAGGHSIRQTYAMDIVIVGDKKCNPSDKFTYVSKKHIRCTEDIDFRYSGELHIFFAEKQILLMAGRDCPPPPGKKCKGPCLYNVIVARCPTVCLFTGILHWTEKSMSERVFASAYHPCQVPCGGGDCETYFQQMAKAGGKGCVEDGGGGPNIDIGDYDVEMDVPKELDPREEPSGVEYNYYVEGDTR